MTDDQIKYLANRFLAWRLPDNFNPDAGISFKATFNEHTAHPMKHEPTGTNLFDFTQAEEMIRYLVDGMPCAVAPVETPPNKVLEMPASTFKAKLFESPFHSEFFKMAGTLDGFIDLAIPQGGTYPLSIAEARLLSCALNDAIADVEQNCLHERDSLLEKK